MTLATPEFLQTKTYTAMRDRLVLEHGGPVQPGVWDPTDFKVVQRGAGANMSVDVGAGFALVDANNAGNKGLYHVENDATLNVAVTAAHATLPRIDQVVIDVSDSTSGGDAGDTPVMSVVAGTATSTANLTNRLGAAALPSNTLRVADILVGAAVTSITNTNILDRRPWARGVNSEITFASGVISANPTGTFAAMTTISAGIQQRVECSGMPLVVEMDARRVSLTATAGSYTTLLPVVDGVMPAALGDTAGAENTFWNSGATLLHGAPMKRWRFTPTAGSHLITIWAVGTGATVYGSTTYPFRLEIWEDLRPIANNGTT